MLLRASDFWLLECVFAGCSCAHSLKHLLGITYLEGTWLSTQAELFSLSLQDGSGAAGLCVSWKGTAWLPVPVLVWPGWTSCWGSGWYILAEWDELLWFRQWICQSHINISVVVYLVQQVFPCLVFCPAKKEKKEQESSHKLDIWVKEPQLGLAWGAVGLPILQGCGISCFNMLYCPLILEWKVCPFCCSFFMPFNAWKGNRGKTFQPKYLLCTVLKFLQLFKKWFLVYRWTVCACYGCYLSNK